MPSIDHPQRDCHCEAHERIRARNAAYMRDYSKGIYRKSGPRAARGPKPAKMPFESLHSLDKPGWAERVRIEQAIAAGLSNSQIMAALGCSYEHVHAVRLRMARIVGKAA